MKYLILASSLLLASCSAWSTADKSDTQTAQPAESPSYDDSSRFLQQLTLKPGEQVVVIAEGDREPRSAGSYSIRLYAGYEPRFPTDDFLDGLIRPRDGSIEKVTLEATDNSDMPSVVVIIRNAGSGGYLSADAFKLDQTGRRLELSGSVEGLASDADPVTELKKQFKKPE
ncbi:PliI family lysozyme inhibitor of I-type lysozyme [Endozoicomonadaceae bacterium StTr2]